MTIHADRKRKNCNHCIYRKNVSRYFDLEDYCSLNMKRTSRIIMDRDCPLKESRIRKFIIRIFKARKTVHKTEDIIQMNTNISLTDRDGRFIEVKVPEPEYIIDPMW